MRYSTLHTALALALVAGTAHAQDDASCATIRSFDPGWTDITATNAVASVVLEPLGYTYQIQTLSVPVGYAALKDNQIDAFLGNWMPAQQAFIDDLNAANAIDVLGQNLDGAKFTLAVPAETAKLGIASLADLDAHADAFGRKIYGIEPGAPANQNILAMIAADEHGLGDWEIVESSEQAMLAEVQRLDRAGKPAVFLAWAPHPMNNQIDIEYLEGGDAYFGPDFGGADIYTIARKEWAAACPNAAAALKGLVFDLPMENDLMGAILDGEDPQAAATAWLEENPDRIDTWLDGVTTLDGQPGAEAVKAALDL